MAKLAGAQKTAIGADSLKDAGTWQKFEERVAVLKDVVAWTLEDAATGLPIAQQNYLNKIKDTQNTAQDIKALTDFLIKTWESMEARVAAGNAP